MGSAALILAAMLAASPPTGIRLLALGDSFTAGTGSSPSQSFPIRLAELWESEGLKVELSDLGVNGYSTDNLIADELPQVASFVRTW